MATVLLIGTLDTKGPETAYLRDRVRSLGCAALVLDSGILSEAVGIEADFNRRVVAEAAGSNIDALRNAGTRGKAVEEMLKGVRKITLDLFNEGKIHGVASLGGAEGAVLAAAAMKVLPVGFPKLIVSPLASGHRKFAPFVGTKDIMVMHSVVDILGLNPVSKAVFDNAAAAIAGMAKRYEAKLVVEHLRTNRKLLIGEPRAEDILLHLGYHPYKWASPTPLSEEMLEQIKKGAKIPPEALERPKSLKVKGRDLTTGLPAAIEVTSEEISEALTRKTHAASERKAIAATMLGNTTKPLMHIRPKVEECGYDFVIFHANGVGGPAMEELIEQGYFAGVLDYTLSEIAGFIAGGFHNGGATRMDAAARAGIPQVIVPGCLDFIVFGAKHEVPEQFRDRPTYYHNPEFTLVRLTEDEQLKATQHLADKLNQAAGPVTVLVPLGGGSIMDIEGGSFWQPETNRKCREALRDTLKPDIRYHEVDAHINDEAFADAALEEMLKLLDVTA